MNIISFQILLEILYLNILHLNEGNSQYGREMNSYAYEGLRTSVHPCINVVEQKRGEAK